MLKKLWQIIRKELKQIIRAKASSLVMIFGPFVMVILIGLAFTGSGLSGIKIGVYSEADSVTTDYFFNKLQNPKTISTTSGAKEENTFTVSKINSQEECIRMVEEGKYHICAHVIQKANNQTQINLYADFSQMQLAWSIVRELSSKVEETSDAIALNLSTTLLNGLMDASISINENVGLLDSMSEEGMNMQAELNAIKTSIGDFSLDSNISSEDIDTYLAMVDQNKERLTELGQTTNEASQISDEKINQIKDVVKTVDNFVAQVKTETTELTVQAELRLNQLKESQRQLEAMITSPEYNATPEQNQVILNNIYAIDQQIQLTQDVIDEAQFMLNQTTPLEEYSSETSQKIDAAAKTVKSKIEAIEKMRQSAIKDLATVRTSLEDAKLKLNSTMKKINDAKALQKNLDNKFGEVNASLSRSLDSLSTFGEQSKKFGGELAKISDLDPAALINPIYVRVRAISGVSSKIQYFFPTLVALIIMFVSVMLANILVVNEKKSPASFRNFITPNKDYIFILGAFLTALIIIIIQTITIVLVGVFIFKIPYSNMHLVLFAVIMAATVFILIGLTIGYMFRSAETGTLFSITFVLLMMSYSPVFMPLELMPRIVGFIAQFNPFSVANQIFVNLLIKNLSLTFIKKELIILSITIFVLIFLVFLAENASKKRFT